MSRIILAVGGSGQMVLHYYVQLHLIGMVREGFTAYVVDSDEPIRSLQILARFFEDVRQALGAGAESANVPSIRLVPLERGREGATVAEMLTQQSQIPSHPGFHHAAQAFFTREILHQDVRSGLYARPALSAVMALSGALRQLEPARWPQEAKVILICSCIGGTGGGIAIPLLWHLANTAGADFQLRAVLLGEYFAPRKGGAVGDDVDRFRSNRAGFLKAAEQSVGQLTQFAFIEEPRMQERRPDKEKEADRLPWPDQQEPYWQGAAALDYLLKETVQAVVSEFVDRCVSGDEYARRLDRKEAEGALMKALGRAESFWRHKVLLQVGREAPVRGMWGDGLVDVLRRYWSVFNAAGGGSGPNKFLREVHDRYGELWNRGMDSISRVFPSMTASEATPEDVRKVTWFAPPEGVDLAPYRNFEGAVGRIAAALLYAALRSMR